MSDYNSDVGSWAAFADQPGQFVARILAVLGGLLTAFLGFAQLVWPYGIHQWALAIPLLMISSIVCSIEASPEVGPTVLEAVPVLKRMNIRGMVYVVFGLVVEGSDWSRSIPLAAGLSLQVCGLVLLAAAEARVRGAAADSARIATAFVPPDELIRENASSYAEL